MGEVIQGSVKRSERCSTAALLLCLRRVQESQKLCKAGRLPVSLLVCVQLMFLTAKMDVNRQDVHEIYPFNNS
uniref:Uncharacterized protein n=1 Tax=Astatotilapia calliptera TaxID=8154 RepID=A0AAX7UJ48_ASTCA